MEGTCIAALDIRLDSCCYVPAGHTTKLRNFRNIKNVITHYIYPELST